MRNPAKFSPGYVVVHEGVEELRKKLAPLTLDELKDIVAQYVLGSRSILKWKDRDRLIELIVKVSEERSHRGDAFRY